mmetsp:Transcript_15564/g.39059  ORF Transcript_15564/g.39059 Transcript_15564/m.39059 type:complete len:125 (+) Transcript_15564:23-397(+)
MVPALLERVPGQQPSEDLARERGRTSIDVAAMTHMLDGGAEKTAWRRKVQAIVERDPVFSNERNHQLPRLERYRRGLEKCKQSDPHATDLAPCPTPAHRSPHLSFPRSGDSAEQPRVVGDKSSD